MLCQATHIITCAYQNICVFCRTWNLNSDSSFSLVDPRSQQQQQCWKDAYVGGSVRPSCSKIQDFISNWIEISSKSVSISLFQPVWTGSSGRCRKVFIIISKQLYVLTSRWSDSKLKSQWAHDFHLSFSRNAQFSAAMHLISPDRSTISWQTFPPSIWLWN